MRILITGGSGFIGTNLVELFNAQRVSVLSIDICAPRNPHHAGLWQRVDILDRDALVAAFCRFMPDVVFHLAARTDLDGQDLAAYGANVQGVDNVIDAAHAVGGLTKVVFASSRLVCRIGYQPSSEFDYCPTTAYGESKVLGEEIIRNRCQKTQYSWAIMRPTSIWGPWFDMPYKQFFLSVARGRYVHPGGGRIEKSFGFVGNTVYQLQAVAFAPSEKIHGKTLYLADYPPIEVSEFAELIRAVSAAKPIKTMSMRLLRAAATVGDLAKLLGMRNPPLTSFRLANLVTPMVHDLRMLQAVCGTLPFSLPQGVGITMGWLRDQGEVG